MINELDTLFSEFQKVDNRYYENTMQNRILNLEEKFKRYPGDIPGTQIHRQLKEKSGIGWVVGFGGLMAPKEFFYGDTIEDCLHQAERFISESENVS